MWNFIHDSEETSEKITTLAFWSFLRYLSFHLFIRNVLPSRELWAMGYFVKE